MSASIQRAVLTPPVMLRSLPHGNRSFQARRPHRWRNRNHWSSVVRLVGHLVTTAFVFISLITLVWLTSWAFSFMHSMHPFSDEAFQLFVRLKIVLIYLDAALSDIVLIFGVGRYILAVIRGNS